jgi:plastocyanin
MNTSKPNFTILAAALAALALTAAPLAPARAQAPARPGPQPWDRDVAALRQQLDDQRDLIMRLTEMEEQRYQYLLKLIHAMGRPGAAVPPAPPALQPPAGAPGADDRDGPKAGPAAAAGAPRGTTGDITGRVEVRGKAQGPVYVYVENVKAGAARGRAVEIKQENKSFVPASIAVQKGTRVTFPNMDPVYHNVFSPSASQPFDLGSYRQGDKAGAVTLNKPGVVEVFCNMHSSMRAAVLVVPNAYYVKAAPDGTYRLENVPIGSRRVVAWTQDANPAANTVELTSHGAEATFTLQVEPRGPHKKKDRSNYDSYPRQD